MFAVSMPLPFVGCSGRCLLVPRRDRLSWLGVVIRNDLVWLRWIDLILCIILIDLCLGILRYCLLVCSSSIIIIPLARRGIL